MKQSRIDDAADNQAGPDISVGAPVRIFPDTQREVTGVVVDDFGDISGQAVNIGDQVIVGAARRWAVRLFDDTLVFVDDADIALG
jgi:hypothetical protein